MPAPITPEKKRKLMRLVEDGWSIAESARRVQVSESWARAYVAGMRNSSGAEYRRGQSEAEATAPKKRENLCEDAVRALDDFGYFRYRYFGRKSTPWQEEAGYRVVEFMATPKKEFLVNNEPPGSGKSTLFTHDLPAWLTCRERGIRGLLGHRTQTVAESYLRQLKLTLENPIPIRAEPDDFELGLAVDAQSTLVADFGLFKPQPSVLWSNQQILVAQVDLRPLTHKEATWSAFGLDTSYIGIRVVISIWDDAVEESDLRTLEAIETKRKRWDKVAERRIEPGGLLVLQGQRLGPEDLYRYNLDKPAAASNAHNHDCCDAEPGKKYHHIVFKAHSEDRCTEQHGEDAPYYPQGCLLDPRRLSWQELEDEMASDELNFATVYQQEDADPRQLLVSKAWITGGTDPQSGELFPGCWDKERGAWELPAGLAGPKLCVAASDPSPTKFWANECWVYTPESEFRWLLNLERKAMSAPDFLDWNHAEGRFSGLMEEWWQISRDVGYPITHWIVEQNAAQRFLLQYEHVKRWQALRSVRIIGHETQRNKADPKMGVTTIAPHWRFGRVRLPGKQLDPGRLGAQKLIDEVTRWPLGRYDDTVMAQWMFEFRLPSLAGSLQAETPPQRRPSWASSLGRRAS